MRNRKIVCFCAASAVGLALSAFAEFKLTPIPENSPYASYVMRYVRLGVEMGADGLPRAEGLPKDAPRSTLRGTFHLDKATAVDVIAYASKEGGPIDTIVFDANGDKDFSKEKVFGGMASDRPTDVALELPNRRTVSLSVMLQPNAAFIRPPEWLQGEVKFNGKTVTAALLDREGDGFNLSGLSDVLLLDLDGNGAFDMRSSPSAPNEMFNLQKECLIEGNLYSLALDADKPDVTLTPFTGPQGKLTLDFKFDEKPKGYLFQAYGTSGQEAKRYAASNDEFPMPLPAGSLNLQGSLMLTSSSGAPSLSCNFSLPKEIEIKDGEVASVTLGRPEKMRLTAEQRKPDSLVIGQETVDPNGVKYQSITVFSPRMTAPSQGPAVRVLDAGKKLLAEGNMAFG